MAEASNNKPTTRRAERIGKYEIVGHIATGGMGVIYKARDVDLDRLVALKILPPDLAAQQTTLIRFQREAKAAAQLKHENIVSIFDVGETNGTYYIALEFIEGTDLQDYITRNTRLDPEEARQIMIQAARALIHAHENGIVHRDIKPSNFLLMHKGGRLIVKLTDFGLAIRADNDAEFRITKDKTTVGTVDYMSPEQARDSRSADIRSDIYSLGCTFYHMLAGVAPFGKGTLPERIINHMKTAPPDVRKHNKNVPESFMAIIDRMLAKKPDDRYQTPAELLYDLEHPDEVVLPAKRATASAKTERGSARKAANHPTEDIDDPEPDEAIEEPRPMKVSRLKRPLGTRNEDKVKEGSAPAPAPRRGRDEDVDEDDDSSPSIAKKNAKDTPVWVFAVGGGVGVVMLVVILAIVFGTRAPPPLPPKEPDKPAPVPVVIEKPPIIVKPPVLVKIDTSPSKMTAGPLPLAQMDTPPDKADRAALLREYYGPFTAFPEAPKGAPVLRVSRLGPSGPTSFRTLPEAFAAVKAEEFTIIEIPDNGPIFVPVIPALEQRKVLLRGADGYRPLIVWDVANKSPPAKAPTAFCTLSDSKLMVENLDFAMSWSDDAPAALFDFPDTDFHARDCTFSIAGKAKEGVALVRRQKAKLTDGKKTRTWLQRCYVRGADMSLLALRESPAEVLLDESLVVGFQHPTIDLRGGDTDSLHLFCVRSTIVAGQVMLRWQAEGDKGISPPIECKVLDSILTCDNLAADLGSMIHLADGAGLLRMRWRAANSVYAGWKQLLTSDAKTIDNKADLENWRKQWGYADGDRAIAAAWPVNPPTGLEEQPAATFLPGQTKVAFAALTGSGSIGCVIGWLPPAPEVWLERTLEPRPVPMIAASDIDVPPIEPAKDNLYHGERIDLTKVPDLGAYLANALKNPAPRVVVHLAGRGVHPTSPIRIQGVQNFVLYFERDFKDPITLEANAAASLKRSPLIEMTGGHLEVIGARIRLNAGTTVPAMVHVDNGSLSLTRCWLLGPHVKATDGFLNLIHVSNAGPEPTTLLLRDNVLFSSKVLVQVQNQVQLKARNNLFFALGDGVLFDTRDQSAPLLHILDHNTWVARQAFFTMRTGVEFQNAGSMLLHANSNAFLQPFADDVATLVRGPEASLTRGRWSWQGRFNVFDVRMPAYFASAEKIAGTKQTSLDWQAAWGQLGEQDAMSLTDAKALKSMTINAGTPAELLLQLDRLALPKELRGDRNQSPPGADLVSLGIKKKA